MTKDYGAELERLVHLTQPYWPYALVPVGLYGLQKFLAYFVPGPQHQKRMDLSDRTVLITGASTGLGRQLAFVFYQRGAKVIATARAMDQLKELCEELQATGAEKGWKNEHKPEFKYLDLADLVDEEVAAKQLNEIKQLALHGGRIDVLVNNAGLAIRGSCLETTLAVQRKLMEVNYFGQVAVTKAVHHLMPDDGAIVNIGSLQSRVAVPYRSAYSASKHALQAFMDCLRMEERPQLQILNVNAGYMNTGFGARALTADGRTHGVEDANQKRGYSADYAANAIVDALVQRRTELILAKCTHASVLWWRLLCPNLLFWLLHKRGQRERAALKQD